MALDLSTKVGPLNARLINDYFHMVETDSYERFGDLVTPDCTFSLMPAGRTFRGKEEVMRFVLRAGRKRRHDKRSRIRLGNWFATGDQLCVEYEHGAVLRSLPVRVRIDGYCLVMRMRDGLFHSIREYINPSNPLVAFGTTFLLRLLPLA